jgi:hypothetical protein
VKLYKKLIVVWSDQIADCVEAAENAIEAAQENEGNIVAYSFGSDFYEVHNPKTDQHHSEGLIESFEMMQADLSSHEGEL